LVPTEDEVRQVALIGRTLEQHGFTIVDLPPDADYGFLYVYGIPREFDAGYSVSESYVSPSTLYGYHVTGQFYALKEGGSPGQLLWSGSASMAKGRVDLDAFEEPMFTKMLSQFPN